MIFINVYNPIFTYILLIYKIQKYNIQYTTHISNGPNPKKTPKHPQTIITLLDPHNGEHQHHHLTPKIQKIKLKSPQEVKTQAKTT